MLVTQKIISNPGLSGFNPIGETGLTLFVGQILRLIDIYLIWEIILLIIGVRVTTALTLTKSVIGVLLVVVLIIVLRAGAAYLASLLKNLSITRPFFF
jgi:hypothetical protein